MKSLPNIEKSRFHRDEYVGYREGKVYRIYKLTSGCWLARNRDEATEYHVARTLTELSGMLADEMPSA